MLLIPRSAEQRYGPIAQSLGYLDCTRLPQADCEAIERAIFSEHYAHLSRERGQQLDVEALAERKPGRP